MEKLVLGGRKAQNLKNISISNHSNCTLYTARNGDVTYSLRCSQEHPDLKKKKIKLYLICIRNTLKFNIYIYIYVQLSSKKKMSKKNWSKIWRKKKFCNRAKPTTSLTDYKGSKPTHKFSKKKKKRENQNQNKKTPRSLLAPHRRL